MTQRFTRVLGPIPIPEDGSPVSWLEGGASGPDWLEGSDEVPAATWLGEEAPLPEWLDEESEERQAWLAAGTPSWVEAEGVVTSFLDEVGTSSATSWIGEGMGSTGWLDNAQPQSSWLS